MADSEGVNGASNNKKPSDRTPTWVVVGLTTIFTVIPVALIVSTKTSEVDTERATAPTASTPTQSDLIDPRDVIAQDCEVPATIVPPFEAWVFMYSNPSPIEKGNEDTYKVNFSDGGYATITVFQGGRFKDGFYTGTCENGSMIYENGSMIYSGSTPTPRKTTPPPSPSPRGPQTPSDVCTAGVSACAFDNGIDFTAVYKAVASLTGVRTRDVNCDGGVPPNTVPVGESIRCAIEGVPGTPIARVLVTHKAPFFQIDCAEVQGIDCQGTTLPEDGPSPSATATPAGRMCNVLEEKPRAYPGGYLTLDDQQQFSQDAREVQSRLNWLGYGCIDEDGHYGPLTEAAVRQFQTDYGLVVDGEVGPKTWKALFDAYAD